MRNMMVVGSLLWAVASYGQNVMITPDLKAAVEGKGWKGGFVAAEILRAVSREYGWPSFKPVEKKVVSVDAKALATLEGRYELRPERFLEVKLEGATLFVIDGEEKVELYPESATRFFELVEEHTITFVKGADGKDIHMVIDGQLKAPRIAG